MDVAAEAAMEADAAFELPFLPEGAADSITAAGLLQVVPPAITALQDGISNLATAMKDLLLPEQAPDQATANADLDNPDLTEVSVIGTAGTAALNLPPDIAAVAGADASQVHLLGGSALDRKGSVTGPNTFARQKSRTERRPKLLLLSNKLLVPLPAQPAHSAAAAAAASSATAPLAVANSKQQIADALKRTASIPAAALASAALQGDASTAQPADGISTAASNVSGVGVFGRAKTVNKATFALPEEASAADGIASMRHSSVTFQKNSKQHSPANR